MDHDWIFEPCSPEDARDPQGTPWAHAVRGQKPQRPMVTGYGHTLDAANINTRQKASQQNARTGIGQRGEVVTFQIESPTGVPLEIVSGRPNWQVVSFETNEMIIDHLERYCEPLTYHLSMGEGWPIYEMPFMPIGT